MSASGPEQKVHSSSRFPSLFLSSLGSFSILFLQAKLGECTAMWFALTSPPLKWLTEQKNPFEVCKHAARYNEFGYKPLDDFLPSKTWLQISVCLRRNWKREPDINLLRNVCRLLFWLIDICRISQPKLLPLLVFLVCKFFTRGKNLKNSFYLFRGGGKDPNECSHNLQSDQQGSYQFTGEKCLRMLCKKWHVIDFG